MVAGIIAMLKTCKGKIPSIYFGNKLFTKKGAKINVKTAKTMETMTEKYINFLWDLSLDSSERRKEDTIAGKTPRVNKI